MRKSLIILILSIFLILNYVSAVTVVTVPQDQTPTTPETHWYDFVKSPLFWTIVALMFVLVIFLIIVFFVVRWLVKYIKQRNDIFWRMRGDRMLMAKIHARYPCKHWWKINKNPPIRLMKKDPIGNVYLTDPIAYYRGDFKGHEGSFCISLNLVGKKKWFFFPTRDLLIIPNKEKIKIIQRDNNGVIKRQDEYELPMAKDIVQFNQGEIILKAEGVSQAGIFLIPVLTDKEGKHMDLALPSYAMMKDVILGDYLYEQSQDYVVGMRKAIDLNPQIRGINKVADATNNVEVAPSHQPTQ
jgi:hypothetical protein